MKNIFFAFGCTFLLVSCNTQKSQKPDNAVADSAILKTDNASSICYGSSLKKDTVSLIADLSGDTISGNLTYNLYEKDRNNGTISGKMYGDTLLADYTFMSEGKESVREVIFLKKDSVLLEGFGNMKEMNGKFVFDNHSALKFGNGIVLHKVPCK